MKLFTRQPSPTEQLKNAAIEAAISALRDSRDEPKRKAGLTASRAMAAGAVLYAAGFAAFKGRTLLREQLSLNRGEAEADEEPEAEEVPAFLTHRGKLLLFKSPESLVAFVRSGATHDLAQLDTWARFAEQVGPEDVQALDEDSYELDLVVENLRGGHDTWDIDLLIHAGEVARDLAYALRLRPVLTALSPGSPLDDLDEALRAAASGGFAGFRGRRRLRRIGAQQASLGWRSVIGKISAAVDWRD
jgi:hypothetical protein